MSIMILISLVCLAVCGGTLPLNDNKTNVGGQGLPVHSLAQYLSQSSTTNATGELAPDLELPILPGNYHNVHPVYRLEFLNPFIARQLTYSILNAVYAVWLKSGNPKITEKRSYSFSPFPTITHYITPMTGSGNELTEADVAVVYLKLLNELIKHDRTWPGAITIHIQDNHGETKGYLAIKRKNPSMESSNSTSLSSSSSPPATNITDPNDNDNSTSTTTTMTLNRPFYVPERVWLELIQRMMLSALEKDSMDYVTADIPPGREYHFTSKIDPTIHAGIVVTKNLDPSLLAVTWKTVALNILVYEKAAAVGRVWKSIDQWMVVVGGRMFGMLWIKRVGAGAGVGDSGVATA